MVCLERRLTLNYCLSQDLWSLETDFKNVLLLAVLALACCVSLSTVDPLSRTSVSRMFSPSCEIASWYAL